MPGSIRQMRLTPELVALVPPHSGETGRLAGREDLSTDDHIADIATALLAGGPPGPDVWIFAYGSLIWNPEFDHVEQRLGTVSGWHRSFCIGWVRIYRGTPERPGLMLGLDRGGSCRGVVFRLPPDMMRENLHKVLKREIPLRRSTPPHVRWMTVRSDEGSVRALSFPVSRNSPAYLPGLATETIVDALATAAGERGSMAEYLHNTIVHLEHHGIHDRYLWRLQDLVAHRIEALYGPGSAPTPPGP